MNRQSIAPPRNLSLTEELEKLEQSITLTLQEIDSNFAKAHRIVTSSILPIVDNYARHSEAVWDGSKFWKKFFEDSANVSLSNYAEPALDDSTANQDTEDSNFDSDVAAVTDTDLNSSLSQDDHTITDTDGDVTITGVSNANAGTNHNPDGEDDDDDDDDPLLTSPSQPHSSSTPRAPKSDHRPTRIAAEPSPFETIRRQMHPTTAKSPSYKAIMTPGKRPPALPDLTMSPAGSSPFGLPSGQKPDLNHGNKDTILHQGILGHTYRTRATPVKTRHVIAKTDDDFSSPLLGMDEAPQLRAEIFSSPIKPILGINKQKARVGVSVLTPGKAKAVENVREGRRRSSRRSRLSAGINAEEEHEEEETFAEAVDKSKRAGLTARSILDWGSDDDDEIPEMSPPKTMRFEFGEGRIIQTPAREASKRIVDDLLYDAGGDFDNEDLPEEYSPSIVIKGNTFADETF